jgi:hypothetical protein
MDLAGRRLDMNILAKNIMGAGAAAVALVGAVSPAQARRYYDDDHISAGEVIAGALVIGGLAAILTSGDNRDRNYDRDGYRYNDDRYRRGNDGYGYDYNRYGNGRQAVDQCVRGVQRGASRYGRAEVTEIRDIDRTRYGYKVEGKLVVQDSYRGYERYDRYDRGYERSYNKGRFTCYVENGRVVDIDYSGLDQWR